MVCDFWRADSTNKLTSLCRSQNFFVSGRQERVAGAKNGRKILAREIKMVDVHQPICNRKIDPLNESENKRALSIFA